MLKCGEQHVQFKKQSKINKIYLQNVRLLCSIIRDKFYIANKKNKLR